MKFLFKVTFLLAALFCFSNSYAQANTDSDTLVIDDKAFTKVEVEASFPGGPAAWVKYISKYLQDNMPGFKKRDFGTCMVRFMVDTHGRPSEVEATTMKKSKLAKRALEAIESGPKWIPAQQNGKPVNAYRIQPITVTDPGK